MDPKKGFDELWAAFPRKHQISKARAAYAKLAPDAQLHARLVHSAAALAVHHAANGTEMRYRPHLHTWLADERWLEDLPVPYENAKDAAIARAQERGSRKSKRGQPAAETNGSAPNGRHAVKIIGSDVLGDYRDMTATFRLRINGGRHDGREFSDTFSLVTEAGQQLWADLRKATGIINPQDTSELHGSSLCAIVSNGGIKYEPGAGSRKSAHELEQPSQQGNDKPASAPNVSNYSMPLTETDGVWGVASAPR